MKKLIIVTVTLVMFAATVSAQETSFGIKGGLNLAKLSNTNMGSNVNNAPGVDAKTLPGFHVGAFLEHKFNDLLGISPEFVYSMQGERVKANYSGFGTESKVSLNYLNIPLLAKIYAVEGLSIDVGPQFGVLLSAKQKVKFSVPGEYRDLFGDGYDEEENIKDGTNTFDMGIGIGATWNIGKFLFQGRYNLGITDTVKYEGEKPSGYKALRNNVLQISAGFRF